MSFLRRVFGVSSPNNSFQGAENESTRVESNGTLNGVHKKLDTTKIPFSAPVDAVQASLVVNNQKDSATDYPSTKWQLEDFEVHRTLGTGSFGRVLLAKHRVSEKYYAIKKLRKADVVRLRQVEHTNNERTLLAQVNHPFLVKMATTFQDEKHLFIVLDYVGGGELFSLLRKVKFYAAEVLLALEYLHERNIIYRDLKPENILINAEGHICLTDFGFAKVVPQLTWTLCGTPDYLAPEIVLSHGYGRAVDVYALGVLIYEMLIGSPPFYEDVPSKLYENIVRMAPRFPPTFDPVARHLIEGLLEKNPETRLGALAGGLSDIKGHPWFRAVQWDMIASLRIRPPFRPIIKHPGDASNFDEYPEELKAPGPTVSTAAHPETFDHLFIGF